MAEWYDDYLKSKHWQRTRLRRLLKAELDDVHNVIRCQHKDCRMWFPLPMIEVHHKTYKRVGKERLSDLEVLCGSCHGATHGFARPAWWEELKSRNANMITMASYRRLRNGPKHIGEIVFECLQFHDKRHGLLAAN